MIGLQPIFLLAIAGCVIAWGLERYRSRYVKADLYISGMIAGAIIAFVLTPGLYDIAASVIDVRQRFIAALVFSNITLIALVLYLIGKMRDTRGRINDLSRNLSVDQVSKSSDTFSGELPTERSPQTDGGRSTIHVVIPAYNEEETIRSVVSGLPQQILDHEVVPVVVSDGSNDRTAQRARLDGVLVVEHPINQGQGGALRTGFKVAQQAGASIVVTMDGDGQHPVDELENLVRPIIEEEADYVMGSRYKGVDYSGNGMTRETGIRVFTWLINRLTKSDITDCTNGFRAIRGTVIGSLTLTEERFSAPELIIEAKKSGLIIKEVPITIESRQAGVTKKPKLRYGIGLTRTIFTTWLR